MPRAILNGTVLAEADQTVVVEGNHYFPPESLNRDHLQASSSKTVSPWKGLASYHDVIVDGTVHRNAGWYYPRPSPLARRIRGHVAFDPRVRVEPTEHDVPRRSFFDRLRRYGRT
jgi:uncharacterized protein (DUF427 family)